MSYPDIIPYRGSPAISGLEEGTLEVTPSWMDEQEENAIAITTMMGKRNRTRNILLCMWISFTLVYLVYLIERVTRVYQAVELTEVKVGRDLLCNAVCQFTL